MEEGWLGSLACDFASMTGKNRCFFGENAKEILIFVEMARNGGLIQRFCLDLAEAVSSSKVEGFAGL